MSLVIDKPKPLSPFNLLRDGSRVKNGLNTSSKFFIGIPGPLSSRVISGTRQQAKGKSVAMISNIRDEYLVNLQKLRKKYENKIRK